MSDIMRPVPFGALMNRILEEYRREGTIFGVSKIHKAGGKTLELFGEKLETPFGPAAGPNTQLAQNIVAAYAAGGRFFELKTVQTMDGRELAACVSKPCIASGDEAYNCEWSTELTVQEAFNEYVKAWFALKLISRELGLGSPDGFMFNMSVGYDLAGIQSEKIDAFIEGLKDASQTPVWQECMDWAKHSLSAFYRVGWDYIDAVSPRICSGITLSTLHGCPPQEIEKIASYLIEKKGLNTFVKCNPTLLGYEFARKTLDGLGFDYMSFDDFHFNDDLQYSDAVTMFRRLMKLAEEHGVEFGVKLTNTFPVKVTQGELPAEEMYMSGRSLYPLTVELCRRLTEEFGGTLRISYCGGADAFNIEGLFDAGIWPITMATTLLKSGGYNRLCQLADMISDMPYKAFEGVDAGKVSALAAAALEDGHYRKAIKPVPSRKLDKSLPVFDCFTAPCHSTCPINQDIPAYLRFAGEGNYLEALRVITERNPLPNITGTICPHTCMNKCMRNHYEAPVDIRAVKLESARAAQEELLRELRPAAPNGRRIGVIGGGPAGISDAFLLARAGFSVTVFERLPQPGGIVRNVIPSFRIEEETVEKDLELCRAMGVEFVTGREINSPDEIKEYGFEAVILATGAWEPGKLPLEYGEARNVIDFLRAFKAEGESLEIGKNVVIVGGGNTAMDAARSALRCRGVEKVSLVYRRDMRNMPADEEELREAIAEGVLFRPLLSPVGVRDGRLICEKMELGEPDASGRRSPVPTGETEEIEADTVIAAVGERTDAELYARFGIELDSRGRAVYNADGSTNVPGLYLAGDAKTGPKTVVEAIAGATAAAKAIAGIDLSKYEAANRAPDDAAARFKRGYLSTDLENVSNSYRCLECPTVCETCCDVCPNRANVSVRVNGARQILHLDGMCNECGNCEVFCPYTGGPYKTKFTLFSTREDFESSRNSGFLPLENGNYLVRNGENTVEYALDEIPGEPGEMIRAVVKDHSWLIY